MTFLISMFFIHTQTPSSPGQMHPHNGLISLQRGRASQTLARLLTSANCTSSGGLKILSSNVFGLYFGKVLYYGSSDDQYLNRMRGQIVPPHSLLTILKQPQEI